jgi:CelD/BcsL family acetyltransferase involved in cellulose biosynthesis
VQTDGAGLVEEIAQPWLQLCKAANCDAPFYRPEWIGAYLRAFEPHSNVLVVMVHKGNRLTGVLPLVSETTVAFCGFPVRRLRGAANVHSCRFDLLRAPGADGEEATRLIWAALKDQPGWDLIELPYIASGGAAEALLRIAADDGFLTAQEEQYCSPYIPLTGVTDVGSLLRSTHFRQNHRRRMRHAQARHGIHMVSIAHADPDALRQFYDLESSGWKGAAGSAIASASPTRRFYDEIAGRSAQHGYFALRLLYFGDQPAAGAFGLIHNGCFYIPKVAYDESYAAYGPGHLLVDGILHDLLQVGAKEFDFLGPSMMWKQEWTREGRNHSSCYVFRPGVFGGTVRSARAKLRRLVRHPAISTIRRRLGF